ncbi:MAG: sugar ABC transporter permease [Clostridiaceae bacterium]|nr:sugar ABC transporter permease [Clostridiaceae bacterium]
MKKNLGTSAPIASAVFMGLGHILFLKQYIKGILFSALEIIVLLNSGIFAKAIHGLISLGEPKPHLPVAQRDNSTFMMLDGLIAVVFLIIFFLIYIWNIVDARKVGKKYDKTGELQTEREFLHDLGEKAFSYVALSPAFVMIAFFVIIPLVYAFLVAFTNYSAPNHIPQKNTVDWVGFETFSEMIKIKHFSQAFARTALWTVEWAFLGTVTCYFGGMFLALALLDKKIKIAGFFRTIFILPYAVPAMISLFIWNILLNGQFGPINRAFRELGIMQWLQSIGILDRDIIPWLSEPTLARIMLIVVNLWLGFPYFMLMITGIMTSMSRDIFEAATIDGASKSQQFRYITFPLLMYQTLPLLIMSFSYNMNNFGGVFFLTNGNPPDTITTQSFAGTTDTLITWMYKLTLDQRLYNKASVVAIIMFLIIAPFAMYQFSRTKSFKEGEL